MSPDEVHSKFVRIHWQPQFTHLVHSICPIILSYDVMGKHLVHLLYCAISQFSEDSTGYTFPGGKRHCIFPRVNLANRYRLFEPGKSPLTSATVREWVTWKTSGKGAQCFTGHFHTF